jgi:Na+-driven multidrug efflux pump
MRTHVKVLGVMFIVIGALGVLMALFLGLIFGAASTVVGVNAQPKDAAIALPFIGIAGTFAVAFLLALSLPGIITGIGLLKFAPWARIVGIVLCVINLIHIPFGTLMGVYGLWVLFTKETEQLFAAPQALSQPVKG